jgi:hypothetical protein
MLDHLPLPNRLPFQHVDSNEGLNLNFRLLEAEAKQILPIHRSRPASVGEPCTLSQKNSGTCLKY